MKRNFNLISIFLSACLLAVLAGCGGGDSGSEAESSGPQNATLVLDFTAGGVHTGIYVAEGKGYYRAAGVNLKIQEPGESTDAPKLLTAGQADFAILDIHDLGIARERGLDLVGVMSIVQHPLAAVFARSDMGIQRPRDLEGRTVGVTGLPSDEAVVDSIISADGGDPAKVKRVTIGFNAVPLLTAGKIEAVTGFWNAEGVTMERDFLPMRVFKVDEFGAPPYPELILTTSRQTLAEEPELVDAMVGATRRGYDFTTRQQLRALDYLLEANPELDEEEQDEQLDVLGAYLHPTPKRPMPFLHPPSYDPEVLREWAAWAQEYGVLEQQLDVDAAFEFPEN